MLLESVKELSFNQTTFLKMYEKWEQTANLNGDDFCARRCFDSNKAISRITRQSGEHEMLCCGIKQGFCYQEKKFKEIYFKNRKGTACDQIEQ